ncbi:MAG: glycerol-3-phosphate acyltransferase [Bacteroidota bacterium]
MSEFIASLQSHPWIIIVAAIVIGYLLGSISTARMVYYMVTGSKDYSPFYETNPAGEEYRVDLVSATWVSKKTGKKHGCIAAILDMIKVALPTLLFKLVFTDHPYFLIVALAGIAGHIYPVYHGFEGGRGESPMIGALLVINWYGLLIANLASSILGYIVGSIMVLRFSTYALIILWYWFYFRNIYYVIFMVLVNFLFWFSMRKDMLEFRDAKKNRGIKYSEEQLSEYMMMGKSTGRFMDKYGLYQVIKRLIKKNGKQE